MTARGKGVLSVVVLFSVLVPCAGMPMIDRVGCAGLADMAGKRPLCALGPMMSALNFWSFCFKTKGRK